MISAKNIISYDFIPEGNEIISESFDFIPEGNEVLAVA